MPGLGRGDAGPDDRRLLLSQLAGGAKDEQIARALGLSVRTVRRRVAGPDRRARRGLAVPGRRRGRPPRLDLSRVPGHGHVRQRHRERARLDVPGPVALGAVELAVGAAVEVLARDADRRPAQVEHVVALVVACRGGTARRSPRLAHGPVENDTITSSLPSSGSASGVISAPPPTREPLPMATIRIGCAKSATTWSSTSMRSRTNGGLHGAPSIAPSDVARTGRAPSSAGLRVARRPGRRRRCARC